MRVFDLMKMCQIEQFNIINSTGTSLGIIKKNDTDETSKVYEMYKYRLVKVITIPSSQSIPTLNVEIKVDRKKKQAVEEMKAMLGPKAVTSNIDTNSEAKIQEPAIKTENN